MISEQDKVRARLHMGYLGVGSASTFSLGIPAALQTQFMIEGSFSKILPSSEPLFRDLLDKLDATEQQMFDDQPNLAVDAVDEIKIRNDEFQQLIMRYKHWQGKLANLLGVVPNPYDQRPHLGMGWNGGGSGINVAVNN